MSAVLSDLGPTLPLASMRPATTYRAPHKSSERVSVENAMRAATVPLNAPQIAALAGIEVKAARGFINNIIHRGKAHNLNAGNGGPGLYAWGPAHRAATPQSVSRVTGDHYDGRELRPFTGRPNAMDAFALPSLHNGKEVARGRPLIIGGNPEARR